MFGASLLGLQAFALLPTLDDEPTALAAAAARSPEQVSPGGEDPAPSLDTLTGVIQDAPELFSNIIGEYSIGKIA